GVDAIRQSMTSAVTAALVALMIAVFNLAYILLLDIRLGLFALGLFVVTLIALAVLARTQIPRQRRLQAARGQMEALALQILRAVPKLRVARAEDRAFARWAAAFGLVEAAYVDSRRNLIGLNAIAAAWQALAIALLLLVIGEGDTTLSTGDFV